MASVNPGAPADQRVVIQGFKGLNLIDHPASIQDTELTVCDNFDITPNGTLVRRSGMRQYATFGFDGNPVRMIGHFQTATKNQILYTHLGHLFMADATTTNNDLGAFDIEWGVQYVDKFFMVRRGGVMVQWDGTTATTITGSPSGTVAIVYKDRMFVVDSKSATNPNRLYFSAVADFSTTGWSGLATFFDIQPGDGDVIVGLGILHDNFMVFKMHSSWFLDTPTDVTAWSSRNADPVIGTVSRDTIKYCEGFLYFVGPLGAYRTDGYTFTLISEKVNNVFLQQENSNDKINVSSAVMWNDKYIVALQYLTKDADGTTTVRNKIFVFFYRLGVWTTWSSGIVPNNFLDIQASSNLRGLYIGSLFSGRVVRYGAKDFTTELTFNANQNDFMDDIGFTYQSILRTKDFTFGAPGLAKRIKRAQLEWQGEGGLTVIVYLNGINSVGSGLDPITLPQESVGARRITSQYGPIGWFDSIQVEVITHLDPDLAIGFGSLFFHSLLFNFRAMSKPFSHT